MLKDTIINLFERDLNRLKEEIKLYNDDVKLWAIDKEIKNSAGNLALHLLGNINHFVGTTLGNNGYVRNREAEFSSKNIPRAEIIHDIDKTVLMIKETLGKISDEEMEMDYPLDVFKNKGKMEIQYFLIHLTGHLNYHLGQINYHRRLVG